MDGGGDYGRLIRSMHAELASFGEGWEPRAYELARVHLSRPEEFLDWAKRNHHWSYTMAEVMTTAAVRRRPMDLAHQLLVTILGELREERAAAGQELGEQKIAP
jgi:hypothetical protein